MEIENLLGSAQDIEGAITEDGKLFVVQTRPQVF
jgi:alpha-glucan,water dikinase